MSIYLDSLCFGQYCLNKKENDILELYIIIFLLFLVVQVICYIEICEFYKKELFQNLESIQEVLKIY